MQELSAAANSPVTSETYMRMLAQLEHAPCLDFSGQNGPTQHHDSSSAAADDAESVGGSEQRQSPPASGVAPDNLYHQSSADRSSICSGSQKQQGHTASSVASQQRNDTVAMAALTVQLFTRRLHYRHELDEQYWCSQVPALPAPAQEFALACLKWNPRSIGKLMKHSFFTAEIRAAAAYVAYLDSKASSCGSNAREQPSAEASAEQGHHSRADTLELDSSMSSRASVLHDLLGQGPLSQKALADQGSLQLCTQSILRAVTGAAMLSPASSAARSEALQEDAAMPRSTAEAVAEVLLGLVRLLPRSLAIESPLPVWAALLGGRAPADMRSGHTGAAVHPHMQVQLMQPGHLKQLVAAVGLSAYLDSVHSVLLSAVCGGASNAGEPTADHSAQHTIQVYAKSQTSLTIIAHMTHAYAIST